MTDSNIQSEDQKVKSAFITVLTTLGAAYYLAFTWVFRASDFYRPAGILGIEISLYLLLCCLAIFKRWSQAVLWINLSIIIVVALHHALRFFPFNSTAISSLEGSAFFLFISFVLAAIQTFLMKIWTKTGILFYFFSAFSSIFTCHLLTVITYILYFVGLVLVGINAGRMGAH